MAGHTEVIDVEFKDIDRDFAGSLCGVAVEKGAGGMDDLCDLADGLNHANLVVHEHHRREQYIVADKPRQSIEVEAPIVMDRRDGDGEALGFQPARRLNDRLVLDRGDDDPAPVALVLAIRGRYAKESEIVCFGGP